MKTTLWMGTLPLMFSILVGCPASEVEPTETEPTVPVDTGIPADTGTTDTGTTTTPIDPNGPITDTCPDGSAKFAALEIEDAKIAYEACIASDADNAGAYIGLAWTELMLLPDRAPFTDALTRCGQTNTLVDAGYGTDGELAKLNERFGGTSTVDVDFVDTAGRTDLPTFDDPRVVFTEFIERWGWGYEYGFAAPPPRHDTGGWKPGERVTFLDIEVAGSFSYANEFTIQLALDDVYGDDSNIAVSEGLVVDIANLPWGAVSVYTACNQPGSSCNGWYQSNYPFEGTLEIVQFGREVGDTIEVAIDARIPSYCPAGACTDRFALQGSITDTVSGTYDTSWLPFSDITPVCEDLPCDERTALYTNAADLCTVEDHLTVYNLAKVVADEFDGVGDAFALAADKAGRHEVRFDGVVVIGQELPFNSGEMNALAGLLHAASAAVRLATSYDVLDPSAVPADLTVNYIGQAWSSGDLLEEELMQSSGEYYYGQCVDVNMYGLPVVEVHDQLAANFLNFSSVADFAGARQGLLDALQEIHAAIGSGTAQTELYDFAFASTWAVDVLTDLSVLIGSLEGTDSALATANTWQVTLDQYFNAPTNRTSMLAAADDPTTLFKVDQDYWCDDEIYFDEGAADWMRNNGFGMLGIPNTAINGDGPWPVLIDGNRYNELNDPATDEPKVIMEPLLEILR